MRMEGEMDVLAHVLPYTVSYCMIVVFTATSNVW